MAPFANGTGQPDMMLMLTALERSPRKPAYDTSSLKEIRTHLEKVYEELKAFTSPTNEKTDPDILEFQVPGGMLSNFRNQLKEQGMADRFQDVLQEIPRVREALGWIPLVTPTSQIVGSQAMLNVKFGPWKMISQPTMDVVLGKYGKSPAPIDPIVLKEVEKRTGKSPIEGRPADQLAPRLAAIKEELRKKELADTDENAVLYAMFPHELTKLYQPAPAAEAPAKKPATALAPTGPGGSKLLPQPGQRYVLNIDGMSHEVTVEEVG